MADDLNFHIEKRFPKGPAIEAALQLDMRQGPAVTVLFGPSGSGKTTILRCLAGLERPERGYIHFNGEVWFAAEHNVSLSPQQRRIGYLFQEYALFPHLTVRQNLSYGMGQQTKRQRTERVTTLLDWFELAALAERYPRELSGGQRQKVALARTVAPQPRLLLLDEPLSALDELTRNRLRGELRRLLTRIALPTLLVTHDRTEAIALGDQLAVVAEGRIQQTGSVRDVFGRPANSAVAHSVGVETVLPGQIVERSNGLLSVQVNQVTLYAVDEGDITEPAVYVCIRAEEVILARTPARPDSARNHLPGRVTSIQPGATLVRVGLDCGIPLVALITLPAKEELGLNEDDMINAVIKATSVHLVPRTAAPPL